MGTTASPFHHLTSDYTGRELEGRQGQGSRQGEWEGLCFSGSGVLTCDSSVFCS